MAIFDWSNCVTTWHFNPNDVRDPTIVYNVVTNPYGSAPGYDGTKYDFAPKNFAPNLNVPKPSVWTTILLDQFGVTCNAKEVILTGNCGTSGVNQWRGIIYAWFRRPGTDWDLSPIFDGGYSGSLSVHAPVGLVNGVPAIEMAWGVNLMDPTNWGTGQPCNDGAWLNLILTGWGE